MLVGWLVGWLFGWLVGWLAGWLVGCLVCSRLGRALVRPGRKLVIYGLSRLNKKSHGSPPVMDGRGTCNPRNIYNCFDNGRLARDIRRNWVQDWGAPGGLGGRVFVVFGFVYFCCPCCLLCCVV